jgi:sugar lactone lactonase YvrE
VRFPVIFDDVIQILAAPDPAPLALVPAKTVATFKSEAPALMESIIADTHGNIFVAIGNTGEIRKVSPDGSQSTVAILPSGTFGLQRFQGVLCSIVMDHDGTIYATLVATDAKNRGVWHIAPDGKSKLLAALPSDSGPNGITIDKHGNLFVADMHLDVVWRISRGSNGVEKWLEHDLLKKGWLTILPGPNGLKFWNGALYVSNSSKGTIVRIPVQPDGSAGEPSVYAEGVSGDDFVFDERGNMYVTTHPFNTIIRVRPDKSRAIIATAAEGIIGPTAAVFGAHPDEKDKLFVINDGGFVNPTPGGVPSVVRLDIGVRGLPIP